MENILNSDASFSKCGLYRWSLSRKINFSHRKLLFIGLNPSSAGKEINDPTTTRIINFCRTWDYGTLFIINLFARITSYSSLLKFSSNPVGNKNNLEILFKLTSWANDPTWDLWLGWGARGTLGNRNLEVMRTLRKFTKDRAQRFYKSDGPLVIGLTKQGHPKHPLYVPCNKLLTPFDVS